MLTSIDRKIIGNDMNPKESKDSATLFYQLSFGKVAHYHHQGWLSGRTTTNENLTKYRQPNPHTTTNSVRTGLI